MNGVYYSAYGDAAIIEASRSIESLRFSNPSLPVCVVTDSPSPFERIANKVIRRKSDPYGRESKLSANLLSPYALTVYLDADTRIFGDLTPLFKALEDGFDFVGTLSLQQSYKTWLWHIDDTEREETLERVGYIPVQWQGGVWGFRKNAATDLFFEAWRYEWAQTGRETEQAAMTRALHLAPMRSLIFGSAFNGGVVVNHRYGMARRKDVR